jgi:[DsrC]-trisulfide reductase subunit J
MYDSGKIIIGIIIFVGLFTSPFWYDTNSKAGKKPDIVLPTKENQKTCIESAAFMRSSHMVLLNDWRNEFVRKDVLTFTSSSGKTYDISLINTCMNCHSNSSQFCDRCHNYMDVSPYCWDCHIEPNNPENSQ